MTRSLEILVLIANDRNATLCANMDGVTRFLRSIDCVLPARNPLTETEDLLRVRHNFACTLMMALCRSTGEHAYDGVVIFAEGSMMEELRRVQTKTISQLIIAQVVGKPLDVSPFPGRSATNEQMTSRGAIH
jgi:hypothetical protein